MDVNNLIAFSENLAKIGNAIDGILEDGEVDLSDLISFKDLILGAFELLKTDFEELRQQLKDSDESEKEKVANAFKNVFNIKNDSYEAAIETAVDVLLEIYDAIETFKEVIGKFGKKAV